jgi:hypothetical protein
LFSLQLYITSIAVMSKSFANVELSSDIFVIGSAIVISFEVIEVFYFNIINIITITS